MAKLSTRIIMPIALSLSLVATAFAQTQSLDFGDGSCLAVPQGWRPAPPGWMGMGIAIVPGPKTPPPPKVTSRTLLRGEGDREEGVTVIPAAAGRGFLEHLFGFKPQLSRPEEAFSGFSAYAIDHGEILYHSADGTIVMDCQPRPYELLFDAGVIAPSCSVASRALDPAYRLQLTLPFAQRREVAAKVAEAVALVRPSIRRCD